MSRESKRPTRGERHSTPAVPPGKPAATPAGGAKRTKPAKPYTGFPLTPHPAGYWCKKIRGKIHYFGRWDDPDGALENYNRQKDDLHAGRRPRPEACDPTVGELCTDFLDAKDALVQSGELRRSSFASYRRTTDALVSHFGRTRDAGGLGPADFAALRVALCGTLAAMALGNMIQRVRGVFRHGFESGLLAAVPRYGPGFAVPSRKTLRLERARKGPRLFEAAQVRLLLAKAGVQLRGMILLGLNCGFGNADCGSLPLAALDLGAGWVTFPRPKTGVERRCALWPETVEALRAAIARRPQPRTPGAEALVFLTHCGAPWHRDGGSAAVAKQMKKLLDAAGIGGNTNFYALRHTFETIGGEAKDQVAVDHVMGHARDDMASVYRERVSDERLRAVSDHVRAWLWPGVAKKGGGKGKGRREG